MAPEHEGAGDEVRVLVLGGYGLIGLAVCRRLLQDGHSVIGLARSTRRGRALLAEAEWIEADLSRLTSPAPWQSALRGIDVVVNASGVLQRGLRDDLMRVQRDAIIALIAACEEAGVSRFIQISAPGVSTDSDTDFYRSKAAADAALKNSRLNWTIFRPGLVLSPQAYGGTSLVRMLAAFPLVQPLVLARARLRTVFVGDVAAAVASAVGGDHGGGDFDLVEAQDHTLESLVLDMRAWLGFARPLVVIRLPRVLGRIVSLFADIAGWLGWRPALRTTALKVLAGNVIGDGKPWAEASGAPLRPLDRTLRALPATVQERVFARAQLAFPILLVVLAGFWIVSGILGLVHADAAAAVLRDRLPGDAARLAVTAGSVADIAIGAALLVRPFLRSACLGSIALSAAYLVGATLFVPELWADPLGPLVKVLPAMALALAVLALAERR